MSGFRLTPRAIQSLASIFAWTIAHFGEAHAADYRDGLIRRCEALANRRPPHGRPCDVLATGHGAAKGLFYYKEGAHFIIFQRDEHDLVVIDFIHERRDLPKMIDRISRTDG